MKKIGRACLIPAFIAFLSFSCSESFSLLPDNQSQPEITVKTIRSGAVVMPGNTIPVEIIIPPALQDTDQEPDTLSIELMNRNGELVAASTFAQSGFSGDKLQYIDIPRGIEIGLYSLKFKFSRNNFLLKESTYQFFYTFSVSVPESITSYPPSLYPEASCLLEAVLNVPAGMDPYLVWKTDSTVLFRGNLSAGFSRVQWTAPQEVGVYNIRLEVYPFSPGPGETFAFSSSQYLETKIYVTKKPVSNQNELPGGSGYFSLFHFRGDLRDEGFRSRAGAEAVAITGEPKIAKQDGIFGYAMDGGSGFSIPALLLPVNNQTLGPFSIELRVKLDEIPAEDIADKELAIVSRRLFSAGSGTFSCSLMYDQYGIPSFELVSGSQKTVSLFSYPVVPMEHPVSITVSVFPEASETTVFWYLNGILLQEDVLNFKAPPIISEGVSIIGASRTAAGFIGIIDEFGIFARNEKGLPDVDSRLYLRAKQERYGRDLILAEGFDSVYMPDWIDRSPGLSIRRGKLTIRPGSVLKLPPLDTGNEFLMDIAIPGTSDESSGYITITSADSAESLKIPFSSLIEEPTEKGMGSNVRIIVMRDAKGFRLLNSIPAPADNVRAKDGLMEPVIIRIGVPSEGADLIIDNLCIVGIE